MFFLVPMRTHSSVVVMTPRVAIAWVVTTPLFMLPIAVAIPVPIVMDANLDVGIDRDQLHLTIARLQW